MTKARDLANVATNATDAANAIPDTLVDAKGDLIVASTSDTVVRVAIGANDTILTADSSTTSGVKWATAAPSFTSYYINSTNTNPINGSALTDLPAGSYIGTMISVNSGAAVSGNSYDNSFYASSLSDIDFLGTKNTNIWTTRTSNISTTIEIIYHGNGVYIAAGRGGQLRTSTDGITWTTRTVNFGTSTILSGAFGNSTYVIGGAAAQIRTSTNGTTWTTRTSAITGDIRAMDFGNGIFVAGTFSGTLQTSTDGITWTSRTSGFGTSAIRDIVYGDGIFVAVGSAAKISTSTDGITWTSRVSTLVAADSHNILSVAYGNGKYVGSTENAENKLVISTDAITWTSVSVVNVTTQINRIRFGNGVFVAGGSSLAISSLTGNQWELLSPTGIEFTSVGYGNNLFLIGASSGALYTAPGPDGIFEASFIPVSQTITLP